MDPSSTPRPREAADPSSTLPPREAADPSSISSSRKVTECRPAQDGFPFVSHPEWTRRLPWVVQGTTVRSDGADRSDGAEELDLRLFGSAPAGDVLDRWERLGRAAGCDRVVHGRQVHGTRIVTHTSPGTGGLTLLPACDGHATDEAGTLLTVSVADCVPVFAVVPATRAVLLLHAGWRGAADGILEAGLELLERRFQARISDLWIHLGPAICGSCYEVGPEVHEAFGLPKPASPTPLDLRDVLATRALSAGATAERVSVSSFCTRCGDSPFFSHRGGDAARQVALLGIAPDQ